jgi:hypothetical protein
MWCSKLDSFPRMEADPSQSGSHIGSTPAEDAKWSCGTLAQARLKHPEMQEQMALSWYSLFAEQPFWGRNDDLTSDLNEC